ncbi:MAG: dihydroxy-acid dehydratase, partial [Pseudomonadales bacterium]
RDGDTIVIDPAHRTLNLEVPDSEIEARMQSWKAPDVREKVPVGSVLHKYARLVSSAHEGCVL